MFQYTGIELAGAKRLSLPHIQVAIQNSNGIGGTNDKLVAFKESHARKRHVDSLNRMTGNEAEYGVDIEGVGQGTGEIVESGKFGATGLFLFIKMLVLLVSANELTRRVAHQCEQ